MICKRCGTKFSDGIFCPECGTRTIPVSGLGGEERENTWEAAFEYSEGERYNTKMYGPQGELEEQRITKEIRIDAGGKKVFENKRLVFEEGIRANDNAKLEFRNCTLITDKACAVWAWGANVSINFENCALKGNTEFLKQYGSMYENNKVSVMQFRNCAFIGEGIDMCGSACFENCFINVSYIRNGKDGYSSVGSPLAQKLEFRNCVVANGTIKSTGGMFGILSSGSAPETSVIFDNCFIRSKTSLIDESFHEKIKLSINNSYFNDYFAAY